MTYLDNNPLYIFELYPNAYITDTGDYFYIRIFTWSKIYGKTVYYKKENKQQKYQEAIRWRNKTYLELIRKGEKLPHLGSSYVQSPRKNKSTPTGVNKRDHWYTKVVKGENKLIHAYEWTAVWIQYIRDRNNKVQRKLKVKSFSINKYGEQIAFENACDYRDMIEQYLNSKEHLDLRKEYKEN